MGRYDRKHSKAMRAAVVYAVEEIGLTPKQVVALAAPKELKAAGSRNAWRRSTSPTARSSTTSTSPAGATAAPRPTAASSTITSSRPPRHPPQEDPESDQPSEWMRSRILEMEEEHRLTDEAQAAPTATCRCPQPNPGAAKLGPCGPTAHCRPRTLAPRPGRPHLRALPPPDRG